MMHLSRSSPFSARSGAMRPSTSPRQHQLWTRSSRSSQSTTSSILPGMGPKSASGLPSRPRVTSSTRRAVLGWSKRSAGKYTPKDGPNSSCAFVAPICSPFLNTTSRLLVGATLTPGTTPYTSAFSHTSPCAVRWRPLIVLLELMVASYDSLAHRGRPIRERCGLGAHLPHGAAI